MIHTTVRSRNGLALTFVSVIGLATGAALVALRPGPASPTLPQPAGQVVNVEATDRPVQAIAPIEVVEAADPRSAASDVLVKRYGVTCMMDSFVTVMEDPARIRALDAEIAGRGLRSEWIDEGQSFVGDNVAAARAFNAVAAFGDTSSVWIVVAGAKPSAMEVRATLTPAGHTVWTPINHITVWSGC